MLVRRIISLGLTGVFALVLAGCDNSGGLKPGIPESVDLNKKFTPDAGIGGMSPNDFTSKKAKAVTSPTPAPDAK